MSEQRDREVTLRQALRSYIRDVLRHVPDEQRVLADAEEDAEQPATTAGDPHA